ncbi:MAG: rhomboid family protein [Verrucomicrobiae bacterium]|nr:rhomboid family protein [Verrucomicrobiae bacterium]
MAELTPTLAQSRCFHHAHREAVARCPECHRTFCRECITEHDDRVVCASCLQKLVAKPPAKRVALHRPLIALGAVAGFFLVWMLFYELGRLLLLIPAELHEGAVWKQLNP